MRIQTYDNNPIAEREKMNIRRESYGFFRVAKEHVEAIICLKCGNPIYGQQVKVNGNPFHYNCYGALNENNPGS